MKINFKITVDAHGINEIERQIEELNLRTEIARLIEKQGYKDYVLDSEDNDSKVVLD
jgi:hypothetical protein